MPKGGCKAFKTLDAAAAACAMAGPACGGVTRVKPAQFEVIFGVAVGWVRVTVRVRIRVSSAVGWDGGLSAVYACMVLWCARVRLPAFVFPIVTENHSRTLTLCCR